jgi:putative ABC transport system ATP-binding protein
MIPGMAIIETRELRKTYGAEPNQVHALRGVSLSIERGEFIAIVGPSGSGKSTLLHMIGGLDRPTAGTVNVDGRDLGGLSELELSLFRRRTVGFIFQAYNLIPVLSAEENVCLPLLLDNRSIDPSFLEELLRVLGIAHRRSHMPGELSGGEQQRVCIGRALASRPSLILADEPTGNLDRGNGREVLELLRLSVRTWRQSLVVITHDAEVASQADRVLSIVDGQVREGRG